MTTETNEQNGCNNCGARLTNGLCNNPMSTNYKQHAAKSTCPVWMKKVYTPEEWSRMR